MAYPSPRQLRREARLEQRANGKSAIDFATTRTTARIFRHLFADQSKIYGATPNTPGTDGIQVDSATEKPETIGQKLVTIGQDTRLAAQVAVGLGAVGYELSVAVKDAAVNQAGRAVNVVAEIIFEETPG